MPGTTPQNMVLAIQDELHDDSLGAERIYRWINKVQDDMDSRTYWHHLESTPPYQLAVVGPYSTGTVTVTNGSATVTGSGTTFTAAMVGQPFSAAEDGNYYFISAVGGATSLTLGTAFQGSTAAGAAYTIDFMTYTLPDDISVQKIKSVLIQNPHRELKYIDVQERNELFPNLLSGRSQPRSWMDWGPSQLQVWPATDANYVVVIRYQQRPTEVTDSVTTFDWPPQMHYIIELGATAEGWRWKDDNLANDVQSEYESALQHAIQENNRRAPYKIVTRPFDEATYTDRFALIYGRRINA